MAFNLRKKDRKLRSGFGGEIHNRASRMRRIVEHANFQRILWGKFDPGPQTEGRLDQM